ncbi:MAG: endonuclease [Candidatus Cloacimonetes bacterium]|nr:endonuclease [Candidatus Cloacimonadota bacterium]
MKVKLKVILINLLIIICVSFLNADYYEGTEGLSGEELKSALYNIIKGHTEYSYDELWDILRNTDENPNDTDNVILLYTGWSLPKDANGGGLSDWNREHVWAKSHGNFGTSPGPGTDVHHIRPTDVTVNSRRGNLDFDNGGTEYIDGDGPTGCYVDDDSWEPRDAVKGDVARMIFYMTVRYEGENGEPDLEMVDYIPSSPNYEPYHAKLSTLLQWHIQDTVDIWEQYRNEKIYENWQHNRNPFIDHPEFVDLIWGGTSVEDNSRYQIPDTKLSNYPNPFSTCTTISFSATDLHGLPRIRIYNIKGQIVKTFRIPNPESRTPNIVWDGKDDNGNSLSSGIFFYKLNFGNYQSETKKMILLR